MRRRTLSYHPEYQVTRLRDRCLVLILKCPVVPPRVPGNQVRDRCLVLILKCPVVPPRVPR